MTPPYEFERFEGQPLLVERFNASFTIADHLEQSSMELAHILDSYDEQIYFVIDAAHLKLGFADLVTAMGQAAGGQLSNLRHPNIKELIAVVTSNMLRLGANALGQAQYGGRKTKAFDSIDDALAYARQQMES